MGLSLVMSRPGVRVPFPAQDSTTTGSWSAAADDTLVARSLAQDGRSSPWPTSALSLESLVEPVDEQAVRHRAVEPLAVRTCAVGVRELDERLRAGERVVEVLGVRRCRVGLGRGDECGTPDGRDLIWFELPLGHLGEVRRQVGRAIGPVTAL